MSVRTLYAVWCDEPGCKNWSGGIRPFPDPDQAQSDRIMRRMGWSLNPDYCPDHRKDDR